MTPFEIHVPSGTLDDLHRRLAGTLLPVQTPGEDWSRGMPPQVLGELLTHWRERYDWREREAALNRDEQFTVDLDGCRVHVLRRRGAASGRLPVVLTHGWPYTFAELLPTLDAINGECDVVVPSLPGYGYSEVLPVPFSVSAVAHRWHTLMVDVLGYDRFLTYGEDVGAGVSDWLAGAYPEAVAGIVASHASLSARAREGVTLTEEEQAFYAALREPAESGYAHQRRRRTPARHRSGLDHRADARVGLPPLASGEELPRHPGFHPAHARRALHRPRSTARGRRRDPHPGTAGEATVVV